MPLESFRIENFKSVGKAQSFRLTKMNLIFGPNSAGKSTLIQSILLYCNLITEGNDDVSESRWGIELGGFSNYVHFQDITKVVKLKSSFTETEFLKGRGKLSSKKYSIEFSLSTDGISEVSYESAGELVLGMRRRVRDQNSLRDTNDVNYEVHEINEGSKDVDVILSHYVSEVAKIYKYSSSASIRHILVNIAKIYLSEEELVNPSDIANKARPLSNSINRAAETLSVGSDNILSHSSGLSARQMVLIDDILRYKDSLDRDYIRKINPFFDHLQSIKASSKSKFGPYINLMHLLDGSKSLSPAYEDIILYFKVLSLAKSFADRILDLVFMIHGIAYSEVRSANHVGPVRWHPTRRLYQSELKRSNNPEHKSWLSLFGTASILPPLNQMLQELGMNYEVKISSIYKRSNTKSQGDAFDKVLELFDIRAGINVAYRDVGTGISQVVPILINLSRPLKILSIEQPELHLHPALQSKLMDVFIKQMSSSRGRNKNRLLLVETHSEHMILRLRKRVRNNSQDPSVEYQIAAEDVNILYTAPSDNGLQVVSIEMDDEGDFLDQWPGGFFEERLKEL